MTFFITLKFYIMQLLKCRQLQPKPELSASRSNSTTTVKPTLVVFTKPHQTLFPACLGHCFVVNSEDFVSDKEKNTIR